MDQKPHDYRFRDLHDIARMIFDFLVRLKGLENESIALCTSDGSVLSSFPKTDDSDGTLRDKTYTDGLLTIIIHDYSGGAEIIEELKEDFSSFFSIFYRNEQLRRFIFDGLDALPNSICIYDETLHLLYAKSKLSNKHHIKDTNT